MKNFSPALRSLLAVCVLLPCATSFAEPPPTAAAASSASDSVGPLTLREDSIDQVLFLLEKWTGKTILRPQALPTATFTIALKGSVTREEAIRALETLLALNGVAVTPLDDKFIKVTALTLAKSEAPGLIQGSTLSLPPSGRTASKIFQLNFLRVNEFMPQIAPLLSPGTSSPPVIFEKSNAALIVDSVSNLQRIETMLAQLDQPLLAGLQPKFYTLRFAKASDVVTKMRTILSGPLQNQIGSATTYNPDDRTNQIALVSDPRQVPFFDELIAKLDVRSDSNTRNDVIYLKHAAAKDVAGILSQLVSGQNTAARSAGREVVARTPPPPGPAAPVPAAAPAATAAVPAVPTPAALGLPGESSNQFSSMLTIIPEERSNSIVVSGTVDDLRLIDELVAKIDILLAQVRIEVVIAEVTLGDNSSSGIETLGLNIVGDKLAGFNFTAPGISVPDAAITTPGVVGSGPHDLAATVNLVTTPRKDNAHILSQPTIVTTHNKQARIFVGESRPVISSYLNDGSVSGTTTTVGGYRSTVGQQEIGIEMKVKPLIGADGSVQLEITQNVDDVLGEIEIDGNPQPRVGKRETESFVSVRSGEIIVLGGLQRSSTTKSTSRLGPVPIIGDLLGKRSSARNRTDLVFFLRPTVLTNPATDNVAAMDMVEKFPKAQRDQVKQALAPAAARP